MTRGLLGQTEKRKVDKYNSEEQTSTSDEQLSEELEDQQLCTSQNRPIPHSGGIIYRSAHFLKRVIEISRTIQITVMLLC